MLDFRSEPFPTNVEKEKETRSESGVEVIWVPRHPVVAVKDVRVGIMPRPMDKLHGDDVIRYVHKYSQQTNGERFRVKRQMEFWQRVRSVVYERRILK